MQYGKATAATITFCLFSLHASAQDTKGWTAQAEVSIATANVLADTSSPESAIDPEMTIRPDTSVNAEMTVIAPADSLDPHMVLKPRPRITPGKKAERKRLHRIDPKEND